MIENVDLIVIGGGIHGCGVAADAAGRGLKVALFEQYDLGSQTSNASTKLIHGGLRYLETGQYRLVYDCLKEQQILLNNAAHLTTPLKFIIPLDLSVRPKWLVKLGLFAYDLLRFARLPKSTVLHAQHLQELQLAKTPSAAFSYYDCTADDHRLVISDALCAKERGASIHTYTQIDAILSTEEGWIVRAEKDGEKWTTRAKALVILAGPWLQDTFLKYHLPFTPPKVSLVQGAHIVVPKLYEGNHAIAYQHADQRLVFFVPHHEHWTLVGTTDHPVSEPEKNPSVTTQERNYLLDVVFKAFGQALTKKDVVSEFAGIRCLEPDNTAGAKTSRESQILSYSCPAYQHKLVSLIGGKITSWRLTSEQIVDKLKGSFPDMGPAWTKAKLAAGAKAHTSLESITQELAKSFDWVPASTLARFAKTYGFRTYELLEGASCWADMGPVIIRDLMAKEVQFLMRTEWACSFEDILDRRTRLGLGLAAAERKKGYARFVKLCNQSESTEKAASDILMQTL